MIDEGQSVLEKIILSKIYEKSDVRNGLLVPHFAFIYLVFFSPVIYFDQARIARSVSAFCE